MKKHLLFNQSFGTEGNPNQTGKTLTPSDERAMTERKPRGEKEQLSSTCLRSASELPPFRSRYLRRVAMIFAVLTLACGNVWGAISKQNVPSSTFTCGTTSGYATYFYTFSSDAANSDTIVFSAHDSYDSSITWASYTGDYKSGSSSWKDKIYAAASGTSEVDRNATPTGLAHKVYNSGNFYFVRSTRTLRYLVTNCTGAMISGYVNSSYTLCLKAYLVTNGTPAASAAQTASITATSQTTTSISGLTASNTYLIEISGSADDNKHMVCEVAFIYPHAGGGGGGGGECSSPSFSTQPTSANYAVGASATNLTATATATNPGTITYKWQKSTDYGSTYSDIDGATNQTYKPSTSTTGITYYRSVASFSGGCSDTNSDAAIVAVSGGNSGTMSGSDYISFKNKTANNTTTSATTSNSTALTSLSGQLTGDGSSDKSAKVTASSGQTYSFTVASGYTFDPTYIGFKGSYVGSSSNPQQMTFTYALKNSSSVTLCSGTYVQATYANSAPLDSIYKGSIDISPLEAGTYTLVITGSRDKSVADNFRLGNWVTIKGTVASSCSAPSSVTVEPTSGDGNYGWRYSTGETIDLTCTASGGSGGSYTYQWQKYIGSTWTDIDGATSARFQKENCTSSDGGSYRCVVSTGAGCSKGSDEALGHGYWVRVFTFNGNYSGSEFTENKITWTGENTGTATVTLNANSTYEFKIYDNDARTFGNPGKMYEDETTPWGFGTSDGNCTLYTGPVAGQYTFTLDVQHAGDVSSAYVNVGVMYPRRTFYLNTGGTTYWEKDDVTKFGIYYFRQDDGSGWSDLMTAYSCGNNIYYTEIPAWKDMKIDAVRLKDGATNSNKSDWWSSYKHNQTNDCPVTSNNYITITGWGEANYTYTTFSIPTYTVSAAASTAGYGTVSAASVTGVACGTSISASTNTLSVGATNVTATPASATAEYTYAFDNWTWTPAGATVTSNVTATANFTRTPKNYDLTWNLGGGTTTSAGTGIASGVSANTTTSQAFGTDLSAPTVTKANYTFSAWSPTVASTMPAEDVEYTATWTANQYSVTHSLTGVTTSSGATGANAATYGTDYTAVFAASSGYELPNAVTVTAGGSDITANCTYTKGTGTVTIGGSYITGNIVITVTGAEEVVCPSSASGSVVYKWEVKSNVADGNICTTQNVAVSLNTTSHLTTLTGGTLQGLVTSSSMNNLSFSSGRIQYANGGAGVLILTLNCAVKTGDVIRFVNYSSSASKYNYLRHTSSSTTTNQITLNASTTAGTVQEIVVPSAFNNKEELYIVAGSNTTGISYFEIIRPYVVTLDASTNGGKVGGANTATYYAASGEEIVLPHAFKSGNYFNGWFPNASTGDAVSNPYTPTGSTTLYAQYGDCPSSGTVYKFQVADELDNGGTGITSLKDINIGNYLSELVGGTLEGYASNASYLSIVGNNAFSFENNGTYLKVTLDCALQAGDKFKSTTANKKFVINTSASTSGAADLTLGTEKETDVPAGFVGAKTLYIYRSGSNTPSPTISYFEIIRPSGYNVSAVTSTGTDTYGTVSAGKSKLAEDGTTTITAVPATGYKVTNWAVTGTGASISPSGASNSNTTTLTMGTADATVTVTFGVESYTLAWNTNGGSDLAGDYTSGSTAYGASITAPNDPTLSNYTFDGWKTNNDGTGTTAGSTMPAANTTYYAAWKQTVTLTTGAQGSGDNQTPVVYLNGTSVSDFTAHTASGYSLQGYYTAGSGGVKVLNADGSFAAANVTDYITSGKWSRTGAAPTLYAQWVAAEDCHTLKYAWKVTGKFCDDQSTSVSDTVRFPANASNLYFTVSGTGNTVSKGSSYNLGNTQNNYFLLTAKTGYQIKSICFYGKVQDSSVDYTINGSSWSALASKKTDGDKYYTFDDIDASAFGIKLTAATPEGVWIRNMVIEVCASGDVTYNVEYDGNDETGGTAPTDASSPYAYGTTVTVLGNTGSLEKTNYTFAGWTTNDDGTGSSYVADNTFSITANTTLYAKWTQSVTLDKNGGSTDGSATAVWNATGLTGITHAKPVSGYKLLGYYSASSDGTKVLNSDGSFAATNVTDYITDGKWSRTSATTLYAEYESAGALTWNLIVNSDTTNLSTSTKTSAFTEISTTNMTDAALTGLTYSKGKKSSLTGKISTPAYDAGKYAYVTFKVADGYKFTPSMIQVPVQPVGNGEHKAVKFTLTDGSNTLASASPTKCDGTSDGKTTTVSLAGDGTYFVGTVTLKIYVYPDETASATTYECYRLGTPITIEGAVEESCATMPSYMSMSYTTTTFAPNADASGSPITIVGGENIDTYQWKYNTTNDRTSGTECGTGTSLTPLTDVASGTTRYYWCEMTNEACDITIKSPAVAITVASAKSDASVTWTDPASTPNYGGGGYTIKATVNETGWDGDAADLVITAPAGIRIYNVSSGTTSNQKWVQADFDVQTSFDRSTYASNIPFTVSAAATATYNAISDDHNTAYSACAGAGEGSSYYICMRKTVTKDGNYYHCANTDGWISPNISSSYSTGKAGTTMAIYFDTVASSNTQYVWVRTYHANVNKVRIYADFRADNMTVANVYKHTDYFTANSKYEVDYSVIYNGDEENSDLGDAAQGYVDITLSDVMMSANDILLVSFSTNRVRPLGAVITESSAGSLDTYLQWSGDLEDDDTVDKSTTDAYFTYSASMITKNTNSLGAITYSSSDPSVATVDATGKVAMVAAGTTTIKATLAASGCYKKAEISYTLNVSEPVCSIAAGTLELTSGSETKCEGNEVTLTLTGFESGATLQWKDGDTDVNHNGSTYKIATAGTTRTLTTNQPGTYSVIVTKDDCFVRSNRITISNISATASVTKIVDEWYVKNGRLTPDIELWSLSEGATLKSVAWSPANETGLSCVARGGVIYLEGKSPSSNDSGDDIEYTLTATITDECNAEHVETTKTIKITHQKNTDKHVLAFVVNGTAKGGFTDGITAAQTTSVGLYNAIAAQFDVLATNIYATDDEKKLKEYYSQFDILCITDYPNTQTKGANSKSYVDAIGSLIDIRPVLTMEAFVSKLANWKAKGISGNPKSPTTRQYTMDLQCKDHEIFAGTDLTKVGEGDEAMYRVSMVDNTKEDYATLDATYGATLPHKEKESKPGAGDGEYNYGGKPALQGFTFTQEMSDNDLLPIGLIDDGAGNPLQVGIERQRNMEARLMVLGINSYAMERLTNDGERVVINALNYLMKKNAEDIADCSTSFVGGAEGEEKNWNNADNWTGNTVPLPSQKVRILADCEVSSTVYALDVLIVTDGKYNHGSDNAAGKLTIKENGALIVGGKIQAASAPAYNRPRATTPDKLLIKTSDEHQAALIFDNEEAETQATVNLYSLGSKPSSYQYQYFAVPMEVVPVNPAFANETHGGTGIYTYVYSEATSGWTRRKYYDDLFAFEGLGITTKSTGAMNYTMTGNLASTATKEITLTHDNAGLNLVGNSWMAPIQIGALAEDNTDTNITKTVYIYCAGRDAVKGAATSGVTETAGQWIAIPFEAAEFETWKAADKLSVIPAMQAFQIKVADEATLTLDYDKVVRGSTNDLNAKLRAPGRRMAANEVTMTNIRVADSKTHTDLSLFEGDRFSEAFDNGWEAEYMNGDGRSAKLYAETEAGQMAVAAMYDYEGTVVGFAPGQETEYTFSFMGEDNGYFLNDIKLQNSVRISEGETYTFTYEEGDAANRFYISRTAINAPEVATGMENLDAAAPKVQKIIYNDKLYIIRGGRLYDATGKVVK